MDTQPLRPSEQDEQTEADEAAAVLLASEGFTEVVTVAFSAAVQKAVDQQVAEGITKGIAPPR